MVKLKGKLFYMKRKHFISDLCRKEPPNLRSEQAARNDTLKYRNIRRREMTEYPKRRICCIKQNSQEWKWITYAWNRINNFLFYN